MLVYKYSCNNCRYLRCYRGGYREPDDYECIKDGPEDEDRFIRVWENGESWSNPEDCLCEHYQEVTEEDFYD